MCHSFLCRVCGLCSCVCPTASLGNLFKILSHCAEDKPDVALQYIDQAVELVKKASTSTYGGWVRHAATPHTPHTQAFVCIRAAALQAWRGSR